eukprot:CAMPEP_0175065286 /NCGR_PEP_ID=MMETSP0052_2-20121109/15834_1 /TAXON_ID=51329 ORGANISM="Polytomella parva, Strain SAG 63-3" /NCGR_SAMPLE_ID=MMETSP0052_2 /ASSEMBLY_ACC=CAM_ASM_000194 /LENGTH=538 /DNA_ID=CAMNT_0016331791 /DNA_START=174 /DNA_END=1787 /DNA_ORIENTATION=-
MAAKDDWTAATVAKFKDLDPNSIDSVARPFEPSVAFEKSSSEFQNADPEIQCGCSFDGFGGPLCETRHEMTCPGQCSGRGECDLGFCRCDPGWYGTDCSRPRAALARSWIRNSKSHPHPHVDPRGRRSGEEEEARDRGRRSGDSEETDTEGIDNKRMDKNGIDREEKNKSKNKSNDKSEFKMEQDPLTDPARLNPWMHPLATIQRYFPENMTRIPLSMPAAPRIQNQPWIRIHLPRPAALRDGGDGGGDSGTTQEHLSESENRDAEGFQGDTTVPSLSIYSSRTKMESKKLSALLPPSPSSLPPSSPASPSLSRIRPRPLIYVYDLPPVYNTRHLQYRVEKSACVWRMYSDSNASHVDGGVYGIEMALHEMLLMSEHRTFDPEEADFFYVPVYSSCMIFPLHCYADGPWFHAPNGPRVMHATVQIAEAKKWIQKTFPYWDRRKGRDHIWLMNHDEGACYAPTDIFNASIFLTHWGRKDLHHESSTAFTPDNYTQDMTHPVFEPRGWIQRIQGHPCFDPEKDLVIPQLKDPLHFKHSPL